MAKQDGQSAVNFQSEGQNVEFRPDEGSSGRLSETTQNVNWNKVGIGVGAAAAVAGAAYAASKFIGRGENEPSSSASGKQSES